MRPARVFFGLATTAAMIALANHACMIANDLEVPVREAGSAATVATCPLVHPPDAAPLSASGGDVVSPTDVVFVTAVGHVGYGLTDGGIFVVGFDLDNSCGDTCGGSEGGTPDLDGGIDDSAQSLVELAALAKIPLDQALNLNLLSGTTSVLLYVEGYNGEADDGRVGVAALVSSGLYTFFDDGGVKKHAPDPSVSEAWSVSEDQVSVVNGAAGPRAVPVDGYVRDHTLVVQTTLSFPLEGAGALTVKDAYIVGTLAKIPSGHWVISQGTIAGRWPTADAIRAIGELQINDASAARVCSPGNGNLYGTAVGRICAVRDIMANASDDSTGKPCNAISLGLTFEGLPAAISLHIAPPQNVVVYCEAGLDCP